MRLSATIEHPYGDEVRGNSRPATAVRYVVESSTRASQLIWRGENCAELRMPVDKRARTLAVLQSPFLCP